VIVRCTKKMLDLLGGRSVSVGEFPATDDDWYLDLIWFDRRKCLLLVHAGTLFSVFRADVRSPQLRPPGSCLVAAVQAELAAERLPLDMFGPLQPDNVRIARTASRSMLGFMNQMTVEIRYQVMRSDDVRNCDIDAINHRLRRTLRKRGGYVHPIDLVSEYCAPRCAPHAAGGRRNGSSSGGVGAVAQDRGSARSAQPSAVPPFLSCRACTSGACQSDAATGSPDRSGSCTDYARDGPPEVAQKRHNHAAYSERSGAGVEPTNAWATCPAGFEGRTGLALQAASRGVCAPHRALP